jgi:hypothetical protein
MLAITDLKAEVAKLKMLRGQTSQTAAAEREEGRSFTRLMRTGTHDFHHQVCRHGALGAPPERR